MQKTFRVYFYKSNRPGINGVYNRLVKARFRGPYSHVELAFSDGWSASASFEDGGTRFKQITFSPENWDYIDLPLEWEDYARNFFVQAAKMNQGYDIWGNVHLAVGFVPHSGNKFFCSEAVAAALGIPQAYRFEPTALFSVIERMVEVHHAAQKLAEAA